MEVLSVPQFTSPAVLRHKFSSSTVEYSRVMSFRQSESCSSSTSQPIKLSFIISVCWSRLPSQAHERVSAQNESHPWQINCSAKKLLFAGQCFEFSFFPWDDHCCSYMGNRLHCPGPTSHKYISSQVYFEIHLRLSFCIATSTFCLLGESLSSAFRQLVSSLRSTELLER